MHEWRQKRRGMEYNRLDFFNTTSKYVPCSRRGRKANETARWLLEIQIHLRLAENANGFSLLERVHVLLQHLDSATKKASTSEVASDGVDYQPLRVGFNFLPKLGANWYPGGGGGGGCCRRPTRRMEP